MAKKIMAVYKLNRHFVFLGYSVLFSLFTVFVQVTKLSLAYLQTDQLERHRLIIEGLARSPYQYRILSEYIVEGIVQSCAFFGVQNPVVVGFTSFRILQNILIMFLVSLYYRILGLNDYVTMLGMSMLAWAMTQSLYDSDLAFNTYSDVILYLAAALVILTSHSIWVVTITAFAALNRETSGLIPFLVFCYGVFSSSKQDSRQWFIGLGITSMMVYVICFVAVRIYFGERELVLGYGHGPGVDYFMYNVSRYITYVQLFGTLGLLPFMAVASFRHWPNSLKAFGWAIVPIWLVVHPFVGIIAETRYFLVPLAMVFIPGALFGVNNYNRCRS